MRKKIFLFCLFFLLLGFSSILSAQTDTEFWFGAPDISNLNYGGTLLDEPIVVRVATYSSPTTVTLSLPSDPTFTPIVRNVAANSSSTFQMTAYKNKLETSKNTKKNGIKITSTTKITAYFENTLEANPEIYVMKGLKALGKEFYIPSQDVNVVDNINWTGASKGFVIVATQSGTTTVTITPANSVFGGFPANVPFTVTLNEGQTWCAAATSDAATINLIGTHVTSDKNIAVTIYEDLINCRAPNPTDNKADLIGDQIVPVNIIGTDYIVVPSKLHGYDVGNMTYEKERAIILATKPNTVVTINGQVKATLQSGEHFTTPITVVSSISTTQPAYVYHLGGIGQESASALLPALGCSGSKEVAITRSPPVPASGGNPIILIIITKQGNQNSIKITTTKNSYTYNTWPSNKGMQTIMVNGTNYVCMAIYDWGDKNAFIPNDQQFTVSGSDIFHLGYYHGFWIGGCRYGYFSDYNTAGSTSDIHVLKGCNFDLTARQSTNGWKWQNNLTAKIDTTQNLTTNGQDKLWVTTAEGSCERTDTFNIDYTPLPSGATKNICNDTAVFDVTVSVAKTYLWNDGNASPSRTVKDPGKYFVVINDGKCNSTINFNVMNNCDSIKVPNVFSPNGDGINDEFRIYYEGDFPDFSVIIFNRWGRKVFESSDVNFKWLPSATESEGTYYYVIKAKTITGKILNLHGYVALVR